MSTCSAVDLFSFPSPSPPTAILSSLMTICIFTLMSVFLGASFKLALLAHAKTIDKTVHTSTVMHMYVPETTTGITPRHSCRMRAVCVSARTAMMGTCGLYFARNRAALGNMTKMCPYFLKNTCIKVRIHFNYCVAQVEGNKVERSLRSINRATDKAEVLDRLVCLLCACCYL